MALSKESMMRALAGHFPVEGVQWAAELDGVVSLRLFVPGWSTAQMDAAAGKARQVIAALPGAQTGGQVKALIAEFVDDAGSVVYTSRPGVGAAGPAAPKPATPSAGDGHTPIGGLTTSNSTRGDAGATGIPGVARVIAVGAGKGGVGKSSIAANLAVGLARRGHAVGLLDADIYGPSMPTMLGLGAMEQNVHGGMLQPFYVHGIKAITIGKLVDPEKPLIWRGPMAHGAFKQLTEQTDWGNLDYLIIDLPPGTGDIALTMAQMLKLTGAVVVCTPQKVAQDDAVRAARMFQQLNVPVLGVVENMSFFVGDDGKEYDLFGRGGAEMMAQRLNLPFLGSVPITMALRVNSDEGNPSKNFEGNNSLSQAFEKMVTNVEGQVALAALRQGTMRPTLKVK
jgi:ATP-binding protein involved in chromosome partitioning